MGLQYVEDADFAATQDNRFPPDVRESLAELAGNPIMHEQYLDFLKCRRFRQTLLCHEERQIHYILKPSSIREFFLGGAVSPTGKNPGEWRSPNGARLSSDHPVAKAAFAAIGEGWPARFEFTTLSDIVRKETGGPAEAVEQVLEKLLWEALTAGLIGAWPNAGRFAPRPTEMPRSCALARKMLQYGDSIVNRLHCTMGITDAAGKHLLSLLDGTRDREALIKEMTNLPVLVEEEPDPEKRAALARRNVETGLDHLAKWTLLEA
jgi:hypothetical protein